MFKITSFQTLKRSTVEERAYISLLSQDNKRKIVKFQFNLHIDCLINRNQYFPINIILFVILKDSQKYMIIFQALFDSGIRPSSKVN